MSNHQVLLKGGNWKKQLLICILLIVIGLVILRLWRPGTISAFLTYINDSLAYLYRNIGSLIGNIQEKM